MTKSNKIHLLSIEKKMICNSFDSEKIMKFGFLANCAKDFELEVELVLRRKKKNWKQRKVLILSLVYENPCFNM